MCDQTKILDVQERNAEFIEKAPEDIVFEVVDTISGFIGIEK
jgi:mRNA interferase MazF